MKTTDVNHRHLQGGFGMVEVLVAMLVLAVGVLGFAALQVRASAATGESYYRSQAMAIGEDLAARVQVNRGVRASYLVASEWTITTPIAADAVMTECQTAACTAARMEKYDVAQVLFTAATQLPGGRVSIVANCPNSVISCIYVAWSGTTPTIGAATTDCVTAAGAYVSGANCIKKEMN